MHARERERATRRGLKRLVGPLCAAALVLVPAAPAAATPVATSDEQYTALGRVFPDPLAGCQNVGASPCSPNAQGNVPAVQFIQFGEFVEALRYMNTQPEWQRYMEVWPLATGEFDGNDLGRLEFQPEEEFVSAGLPTSTLERQESDLYVVRVTDESVPDEGKKRYALSLSIHGIERAGAEGGTRAMEDMVTAATTGKDAEPILPPGVEPSAPRFSDVLKESIVYFTYPNPDGWRRGDLTELGPMYQRYNGNGVDPNRDWPDIGFSFRPYSGQSEPETQAFAEFYEDVRERGGEFAAGDDLHGQPHADALSYTLLPHGRHDFAKDQRIRDAAVTIHEASEEALQWSPIVQPNDAPQGGGVPCVPGALGDACAQIYGQTWGTVYDTINYTTTGTLGDWFDSTAGLGADGIDNEMSFSHLDKNNTFDPHTEQLHVDGNKALIYAHLARIVGAQEDPVFDADGRKGYVANPRLTREEQVNQQEGSGGPPQAPIEMGPKPQTGERTIYGTEDGFVVKPGNGGMRIEVTQANAQGVAPSYTIADRVTLKVQCRACDHHVGPADAEDEGWITVAEDYNQRQLYVAAGLTATVNRPETVSSTGDPVEWRLVIEGDNGIFNPSFADQPTLYGATQAGVEFTSGPASTDGNSGGDEPPRLAAYDVSNTDFFRDLDGFAPSDKEGFEQVDPSAVIAGEEGLGKLDSLILADDALPGYTGPYGVAPDLPPTPDMEIASEQPTAPGAHQPETDQILSAGAARVPGTYEVREWEIGTDQANRKMTVAINLYDAEGNPDPEAGDFDIYLYRVTGDGPLDESYVASSTTGGSAETIELGTPPAGRYRLYVDNWLATANTDWRGAVTFEPFEQSGGTGDDTGAYTAAEKASWIAELRRFAEGGGNLVLTDGALLALPDLVPGLSPRDVAEQTVYVGQVAFSDGESDTTGDPLARDVEQPGARFNSGMRRQTFEPTPLGFAIQNPSGDDQSFSPQFDVDRQAWEEAGGRYVAGSANSAARDAQAVYDRVTVGEIEVGKGRIRIIGSLLPQPTQEYDHPLGIEPYAVTYTGYTLARNLFDWEAPKRVCEGLKGKEMAECRRSSRR